MLIKVKRADDRFDYVKPDILDKLIESKEIQGFQRSSGWTVLGVDPIRQTIRANPAIYHF